MKGLDAGAKWPRFDGFTAVDTFGGQELFIITTPVAWRCEAMAKAFQGAGSARNGKCLSIHAHPAGCDTSEP